MSPRSRRHVLVAYLLLLLASHVARRWPASVSQPSPGASVLPVRIVDGGRRTPGSTRLAYLDLPPRAGSAGTPVLLIHGSPGSRENLAPLARRLARGRRAIVPDLPGFGDSAADLPDYSSAAHADYLLQLLDRLELAEVHVVGFSLGGAVALHLWDSAPDRVRSLVLLSATAVQELELLGDHQLNHVLHAVQLAGVRLLQETVPHFGWLDGGLRAYARNFFDTDQRPLRGILERYTGPMLLLHGERDPLVPIAAALEHHRLVPQSRLRRLDGGHFLAFTEPAAVESPIGLFLAEVEAGAAMTRRRASPQSRRLAREPFDPESVPPLTGLALWVVAALLAIATLISEDLACVSAGLLAANQRIGFGAAAVACFVGIYAGDLVLFYLGRRLGNPALRRRPLRWIVSAERVEAAAAWLTRRGPAVILLSRFLPGTRLPTYVGAGMLGADPRRFALWFLPAVALWTPLVVGFAAATGRGVLRALEPAREHTGVALLALGSGILLALRWVLPLGSYRGRRLLRASWRRFVRWEYWPRWAFYPPLLAWIVWLGVRHRSFTLFTAANPGIEAGGFIAESKSAILSGLAPAGARVARFRLLPQALPPEARRAAAERFVAETTSGYPVVLKPDVGQRGDGVVIAPTPARLREVIDRARADLIVQEYVAGPEYGLFYCRRPGDPRGRLISVTEKRLPAITGDGRRSVERLILDDDRLLGMARSYLARQSAALDRVPAEGESIALAELGTHCRGAEFRDGSHLVTHALERAVDEVSRRFDGFFFGRYDVRAPSEDALRDGRFRVIELNGVTSEATHIYDPGTGLLAAYRTLARQWSLAFEVGRRNRDNGAAPASPVDLLRLLRRYGKRGPVEW